MTEINKLESDGVYRVLAVIVLYKLSARESVAFQTIQTALTGLGSRSKLVDILLYDNSPGGSDPGVLPEHVRYEACDQNGGLATAYNHALSIARSDGYTWLLTLDQDTTLSRNYLCHVIDLAQQFQASHEVAAIAPRLMQAAKPLSPAFITPWGVRSLTREFTGIANRETHAYNSGSLFRVDALKQIGGFSIYFWLDYSDAYIYRQLHMHGKKVYIAGDLVIEHNLSLLSPADGLTTGRYRNFLMAESAFWDIYGVWIQRLLLTCRLAGRLWKQKSLRHAPRLRQLTSDMLYKRLFQSKARRLLNWRTEMENHLSYRPSKVRKDEIFESRPAISVCMAAYNGELFIKDQLRSILVQLEADDEIVVVDDCSTDSTRQCVLSFGDPRIRLIEHSMNQGVSRTFEDALRAAYNGIIFLSDQDDLWVPTKVRTILKNFQEDPSVSLVTSDVALIDADGATISDSYFSSRGGFQAGLWANLLRNRFGGCAMAFRANLIADILPFPHGYDVLHDIWIGTRCSISGHGILYVSQALVLNRRHSSTSTGHKRLEVWRKIRLRVHLLLALARFQMGK